MTLRWIQQAGYLSLKLQDQYLQCRRTIREARNSGLVSEQDAHASLRTIKTFAETYKMVLQTQADSILSACDALHEFADVLLGALTQGTATPWFLNFGRQILRVTTGGVCIPGVQRMAPLAPLSPIAFSVHVVGDSLVIDIEHPLESQRLVEVCF